MVTPSLAVSICKAFPWLEAKRLVNIGKELELVVDCDEISDVL